MTNARTTTVPVEGAIAAFHSEVKLGPCSSVLRIVLHYIIINKVYITLLHYTLYLELPTMYCISTIKCRSVYYFHAASRCGVCLRPAFINLSTIMPIVN